MALQLSYQETLDYIESHPKLPNYTYFEYASIKENDWKKEDEDDCVGVLLKGFNKEDYNKLYLLTVASMSALCEHYNVKGTYVLPNQLFKNGIQLGQIDIDEIGEGTYLINYYMRINNSENSVKKIAKKMFKIKNASLTIQTYFKIYYHFYETQDFNQVVDYLNGLQDTLKIEYHCNNIAL